MPPLISVLTPVYNSAQYLNAAIQSVSTQDYPEIEHIVIDGGSSDGTLDIVKAHDHLRWISEADEGQADALNKGLAMAGGEIIAWINADDTFLPGAFSQAVKALASFPQAAVVYADMLIVDGAGKQKGLFPASDFNLVDYMLEDTIPQQAAFFRRSALEEIGGWDPTLYYLMDYDLFLRLGTRFPLQRVAGTWGTFRLYPGTKSMTSGVVGSRREKLAVLRKVKLEQQVGKDVLQRALAYSQMKLTLAQALEAYQLGSAAQAATQLGMAVSLYPQIFVRPQDALVQEILAWVDRCAYDAPRQFVTRVLQNLPPVLAQARGELEEGILPHLAAADVFAAHRDGDRRAAWQGLGGLLRTAPRMLLNRGLLSVGLKVLAGSNSYHKNGKVS